MKLTKSQIKSHENSLKILEKNKLSYEDKLFVLENFNEGAESMNSKFGAFFTPNGLARDFQLEISNGGRIIDLCAGIGSLSFFHKISCDFSNIKTDITCIECNKSYIEVGKKILPEANWIHGSAIDTDLIMSLGEFDVSISNPPFGRIKSGLDCLDMKYKGGEFEYKIIEIASKISKFGVFILPQNSTPFKYSGNNVFEDLRNSNNIPNKLKKFINETGLNFEFNCGIDTSYYKNDWKGVSPICEIVTFNFSEDA